VKVILEKYGGFAAGIRQPPHIVDSTALPETDAEELAQLVSALKGAPAVEEESPGRARDAMSYTITVEDGGKRTVFRQSDMTMSPLFAALLQWLELHAV
jgi:hypothetical protein